LCILSGFVSVITSEAHKGPAAVYGTQAQVFGIALILGGVWMLVTGIRKI